MKYKIADRMISAQHSRRVPPTQAMRAPAEIDSEAAGYDMSSHRPSSDLLLQRALRAAVVHRSSLRRPSLQRMSFKRFGRFGLLSNWGSYSADENALLMLESSVANYIASLEPWATDDKQIKARLADYVAIQGATYSEHEYDRARKALTDVERGLRTRRAQLLNENPARVAADPTFENHLPEALTGEIQQFLGRRAIDERAFRLVVPVPDEHLPTVTGLEQADFAEDLGSALRSSIRDQIDTLGAKLESEGELLWVYSVDGLLSVGSKDENKHSVVGAGAEAWAAGTVRLKISEGEAVYRRYLSEVEKAAWYKQRVAEIEADESLEPGQRDKLLRDVRDNQREYEKEAERDRREYEKLRYDPDEATRSGKTVVLDFDSGHYRPRGAWRRAMSAWNKLGYKVEFNPEGRTA